MATTAATEDLPTRFKRLRDVRETEPEIAAKRAIKALKDSQRASDDLVEGLRAQLSKAKQTANQNGADGVEIGSALSGENAELSRKNEQLQRQLRVFQLLTGMNVEVDASNQAHCSCRSGEEASRELSFKIDLAPEDGEDEGDIGYTPCSGDLAHLPDYLQEEITCAPRANAPRARTCGDPMICSFPCTVGNENAVPFMHKVLTALVPAAGL